MKYRKKPVEIEAVKYRGIKHEVDKFCPSIQWRVQDGWELCIIPTLEGEHEAKIGDFIIKGVKGEFYPCKPDIFEMTYEPVGKSDYEHDLEYNSCI